jgi:hypothetical protein
MQPTRTQPATKALIARSLDRTRIDWGLDCDDDPYVVIPSKERPESFLQCWFLLEGQVDKIFRLSCLVQPVIPWKNLAEALILCNQYPERFRFGRLYCQPAAEPEEGITLYFEGQLDVTDGVSEAFLATFIESHVASICAFLAKAFRNKKLFAPPPKPRRKRSSADGKKQGSRRRPSTERRDVEQAIE